MEADKEVHQTLFVNERGSITSYDLRRRNSWWSGRCRSRLLRLREPLVANCKVPRRWMALDTFAAPRFL